MPKGSGKKDDDDELMPSPEQAQAYAQISHAAIALARLDKFCAGVPASQMTSHPSQQGCMVLQSLGQSMALVEYAGKIGLAVPPAHANWIHDFPFDFIAVTRSEMFFVSKGFTWLGSEVPPLGISLGPLMPSPLLARLCQQKIAEFFRVDSANIADATEGEQLREERPVMILQVPEGVDVLKTRQLHEREEARGRTDTTSTLTAHFLG